MSDLHEPWATPTPAQSPAPARRRWQAVLAAAVVVMMTAAVIVGWLLTDHFRKISRQTAYNRVNKATQSLVTMLGQDPAQHPT